MVGAPRSQHRALLVAAAAVAPLVVNAVLSAFRSTVTNATGVLVLVVLVVAAAATGDRLAGLVAALSAGAWFDFFLTEPYGRFTITDSNDIEATVLLVVVGAAVTEVALWGRRQQARASRRAGYLDGVLSTAELGTVQHEPAELTDRVARQIAEVLAIPACQYVAGPVLDQRFAILHHDGLVTRRGHQVDVDRDGLPTDDQTALLVRHGGETVGHFLLTAADQTVRPTLEQRRVAVLLADQVAAALGNRAR
jgi:K+-sensing histidine kinase KdpD